MGAISDVTAEFRTLPPWGKFAALGGAGLVIVLLVAHARSSGSSTALGLYPTDTGGTITTNAPPTSGTGGTPGTGGTSGTGGGATPSAGLLAFLRSLSPVQQQADYSYFTGLSAQAQQTFLGLPLDKEIGFLNQYNAGLNLPPLSGSPPIIANGMQAAHLADMHAAVTPRTSPAPQAPSAIPVYVRFGGGTHV